MATGVDWWQKKWLLILVLTISRRISWGFICCPRELIRKWICRGPIFIGTRWATRISITWWGSSPCVDQKCSEEWVL
jgi:hypothetical protein